MIPQMALSTRCRVRSGTRLRRRILQHGKQTVRLVAGHSRSNWNPLKVQYDGGISLQEIVAHPAGGGGVVLQWETAPKIDTVFALSFRLYNTEDEQVYQQDTVIWNQITGNTKSRGHPSPFRTLVLFDFVNAAPYLQYNQTIPLDFPEDLPSGKYDLRLIVYDAATLQPTVEMGSWKPEILLARLQHERDPLNEKLMQILNETKNFRIL